MKKIIFGIGLIALFIVAFNMPEVIVYAKNEPVEVVSIDQLIKDMAVEYGQDPVLVNAIIACESGGKIDAVGTMAVVGKDIGLMQINSYFHEQSAIDIGLNIYEPEDNLRYGMILMSKQGSQPWKASEKCWKK